MTTTPPPARMLLAALLGAAVLSPAARLEAAAPCPGGRFVVAGAGLRLGTAGSTARVVEVGDGPTPTVTLEGPCAAPAVGTRRERRFVSAIRARFAQCAAARRVRLQLSLEHGCAALTGTVIVRGRKIERFVALPSACGDGFVDARAREACEPGNPGCDSDCSLAQPDVGRVADGGGQTPPLPPPPPPADPDTQPADPNSPPPTPPPAAPTVRLEVVNKHQYSLIGLTVNGTSLITDASQVVPSGERFVVGDVPPGSDVKAELGPVFGEPALFVLTPAAVEHDGDTDRAFILPTTIGELLTGGAPSRDWSASFVSGFPATQHTTTFRFALDGSWTLIRDGETTQEGIATLTDWPVNATRVLFHLIDPFPEVAIEVPFTSFTIDGAVFTPQPEPPPDAAPDPDRQPRITSLSPASGRPGDVVIIEGENFDRRRDGSAGTNPPSYRLELPKAGANPIFHVGMAFDVISPTQIKAIIPDGAASGPIVLAEGSNPRTAGFASSPVALTILP